MEPLIRPIRDICMRYMTFPQFCKLRHPRGVPADRSIFLSEWQEWSGAEALATMSQQELEDTKDSEIVSGVALPVDYRRNPKNPVNCGPGHGPYNGKQVILELINSSGEAGARVSACVDRLKIEHLVVVGREDVVRICNGFLRNCNHLKSVTFICPWVVSIGDGFLQDASDLQRVCFAGLGAVETMGDAWMFNCCSLPRVSFEGLSSLRSVGTYWMGECPLLLEVDDSALVSFDLGRRTSLKLKCQQSVLGHYYSKK